MSMHSVINPPAAAIIEATRIKNGLTELQRDFCLEYMRSGRNGSASAKALGIPNPAHAARILLGLPHIRNYITWLMGQVESLEFLTPVEELAIQQFMATKHDAELRLSEILFEGSHRDAIRAIEVLGKLKDWFTPDKLDITVATKHGAPPEEVRDRLDKLRKRIGGSWGPSKGLDEHTQLLQAEAKAAQQERRDAKKQEPIEAKFSVVTTKAQKKYREQARTRASKAEAKKAADICREAGI